MRKSLHYAKERRFRERNIQEIGEGVTYAEFIVDNGHKNGAERHVLTTNGIIIIYNARTNRLVTKLIARPGQIKRYYPEGDYPAEIVAIALEHAKMHINH